MPDIHSQPKTRRQPSPYDRRKLARERLEIYLVHLLLMYRAFILTAGILLLLFSIAVMVVRPAAGIAALLPAVFLCLLGSSYSVVLFTARAGAWLATLGRQDP